MESPSPPVVSDSTARQTGDADLIGNTLGNSTLHGNGLPAFFEEEDEEQAEPLPQAPPLPQGQPMPPPEYIRGDGPGRGNHSRSEEKEGDVEDGQREEQGWGWQDKQQATHGEGDEGGEIGATSIIEEAWSGANLQHEDCQHESIKRGEEDGDDGTLSATGPPLAIAGHEGIELPRPPGAAGRPQTRRVPRAEGRQSRQQQLKQAGQQVVYVDHHHVHHHHHFHRADAWPGATPGDVPPEPDRRDKEARAQADSEFAHAASAMVGGSSTSSTRRGVGGRSTASCGPMRRPCPSTASAMLRGSSRQRARGHSADPSPPHLAVAHAVASGGVGSLALAPTAMAPPQMDFSAEALVCRDSCWPESGMTFTTSSVVSQVASGGSKVQPRKLPLNEYFSLISRLPGESRLKFSPYSVPRSGRNYGAMTAR